MEKSCEFCTTSRPVVYCKSDAAHLCLSCDAKVHSANALSNRHLRTPLCDLCRHRPSHVCCFNHRMFLCRGCDQSLHDVSSHHLHQRRAVSSYLGCPSAKDFAALWGFELNELDNNATQDQALSNSCISMNPKAVEPGNLRQSSLGTGVSSSKSGMTSLAAAGHNSGSNCQRTKVISRVQQIKNTSLILQQIIDLKKFQLTEGDCHLPLNCSLEQADTSSSIYNSSKNDDSNLVQDTDTNIHQSDNPLEELNTDMENLLSSSTSGMPFYGESIWQCKSPIRNSQLWSQNMQDLGVCEDTFCQDDFNMPDIDLSFRNFEDLFGVDQHPTRGPLASKDVPSSSMEKEAFNNSNNVNAISMEVGNDGMGISLGEVPCARHDLELWPGIIVEEVREWEIRDLMVGGSNTLTGLVLVVLQRQKLLTSTGNFQSLLKGMSDPVQQNMKRWYDCWKLGSSVALDNINIDAHALVFLELLISHSPHLFLWFHKLLDKLGEIPRVRYAKKGLTPTLGKGIITSACTSRPSYSAMPSVSRFSAETSAPDCLDNGVSAIIHGEASCISPDLDSFHSEARENAMVRYKEKKKARLHERQINSASRKARTDVEKRVKGRIVKREDYDSDNPNVTKSC
ncbi:hypothetical protein Gogos_009081 [Gossypium gossypioides]|uniref:B box-type domain-containing protein n=1 Tax=Gossypium gossypioides TaxID=34282 RepID=A0A7J9CEJ3_GOSGO|nr:hypothetical protein [Gossypium gossypioides]